MLILTTTENTERRGNLAFRVIRCIQWFNMINNWSKKERNKQPFEDLPADWRCPRCKQPKEKFNRA